jgi:putative flippase GtrA
MMADRIARARTELLSYRNLRHYGGFASAAVLAFITDAGILEALTQLAGWSPFIARPIGISCAMVVAWLFNRTVTFAMSSAPSLSEFLHYAAVSWVAQAINYIVFSAILIALPGTALLTALVLACFVSMFVSYSGYRFGVFRKGRASS